MKGTDGCREPAARPVFIVGLLVTFCFVVWIKSGGRIQFRRPMANKPHRLERVSTLIKALRSPSATDRYLAVNQLSMHGPNAKDALPALLERLQDPIDVVRISSAFAIERVGKATPEAMRGLQAVILSRESKDDVFLASQHTLAKLGPGGQDVNEFTILLLEVSAHRRGVNQHWGYDAFLGKSCLAQVAVKLDECGDPFLRREARKGLAAYCSTHLTPDTCGTETRLRPHGPSYGNVIAFTASGGLGSLSFWYTFSMSPFLDEQVHRSHCRLRKRGVIAGGLIRDAYALYYADRGF